MAHPSPNHYAPEPRLLMVPAIIISVVIHLGIILIISVVEMAQQQYTVSTRPLLIHLQDKAAAPLPKAIEGDTPTTQHIPTARQSSTFSLKNKPTSNLMKSSSLQTTVSGHKRYQSGKHQTSENSGNTTPKRVREVAEAKLDTITTSRNKASASLRHWIQQNFQKYYSYPYLARRKGWQGTVILDFNVEPSGIITDIKVTESSGYNILDRAAKSSLEKVSRVDAVQLAAISQSLSLRLPVSYRLE